MATTKKTATATATAAATPKIVSTALDELLAHPASVYVTAPTELTPVKFVEAAAYSSQAEALEKFRGSSETSKLLFFAADVFQWIADNAVTDFDGFNASFEHRRDSINFVFLYVSAVGELLGSDE